MISYPSNLPQPSQQFTGETSTPVVRTDLPMGLVRQESRYATARRQYKVSWVFNREQLVAFEEWYQITLGGGVLMFELLLHGELPEPEPTPVRFIDGGYQIAKETPTRWRVSASVEQLTVETAPTNRTPAVPVFTRLGVDPAESQVLTLHHRNAVLTVRPEVENTTLLQIYPPTGERDWIYLGVNNQGLGETRITSDGVLPLPVDPTPSFPVTLPAPQLQYSERVSNVVARIDMESGHVRQYVLTDGAVRQYELSWELTLEEYHTFREFFFDDLKSGSTPFLVELDVDGQFAPVVVRFVGGSYKEWYVSQGQRFLVAFQVDRNVEQTVSVTTERPYPVFYSPTVNVTTNRKVSAADAGKLFVCNPAAGQTVNLHIYTNLIEFGVLNKGLGDVLITRGPFVLDLGGFTDNGSVDLIPVQFELRDTIRTLSIEGDSGSVSLLPVQFERVSVVEDLGSVGTDSGAVSLNPVSFDKIEVLVDAGTITDTGTVILMKPVFELQIP